MHKIFIVETKVMINECCLYFHTISMTKMHYGRCEKCKMWL